MGKIYAIFIELYMKGDLFVRREITHIKRFVLSVPLRYKQFLCEFEGCHFTYIN